MKKYRKTSLTKYAHTHQIFFIKMFLPTIFQAKKRWVGNFFLSINFLKKHAHSALFFAKKSAHLPHFYAIKCACLLSQTRLVHKTASQTGPVQQSQQKCHQPNMYRFQISCKQTKLKKLIFYSTFEFWVILFPKNYFEYLKFIYPSDGIQ